MITVKKTIEITYYLEESVLEAFADRNGYDANELNEAINNNELGVEWLCTSLNETIIDYKVERS
jgi:hypothetical protein